MQVISTRPLYPSRQQGMTKMQPTAAPLQNLASNGTDRLHFSGLLKVNINHNYDNPDLSRDEVAARLARKMSNADVIKIARAYHKAANQLLTAPPWLKRVLSKSDRYDLSDPSQAIAHQDDIFRRAGIAPATLNAQERHRVLHVLEVQELYTRLKSLRDKFSADFQKETQKTYDFLGDWATLLSNLRPYDQMAEVPLNVKKELAFTLIDIAQESSIDQLDLQARATFKELGLTDTDWRLAREAIPTRDIIEHRLTRDVANVKVDVIVRIISRDLTNLLAKEAGYSHNQPYQGQAQQSQLFQNAGIDLDTLTHEQRRRSRYALLPSMLLEHLKALHGTDPDHSPNEQKVQQLELLERWSIILFELVPFEKMPEVPADTNKKLVQNLVELLQSDNEHLRLTAQSLGEALRLSDHDLRLATRLKHLD